MLQGKINLANFKKYASYIYKNLLEEATLADLKRNKEYGLPLLKLFAHLDAQALHALFKKGMEDFLLSIMEDSAIERIRQSMQDWKEDKLPGIRRDQVSAPDIALIYNARKHTLLSFLPAYTSNVEEIIAIVKEIEDFYTFQENLALQVYADIKQEEIRVNESRLKEAQTLAHLGNWEFNQSTGKIYWSDELYNVYGIHKKDYPEGISASEIASFIIDEDLTEFRQRTALASKVLGRYSHEYRIVRKSGEIRRLWDEGYAEKNAKGEVVVKGVSQDITDRKKNEEKLRKLNEELENYNEELATIQYQLEDANAQLEEMNLQLEERVKEKTRELQNSENNLRLVMNSVPAIIAWVDRSEKFKFVNDSYYKWFGKNQDQVAGKTLKEVFGEQGYETLWPYIEKAFNGEESEFEGYVAYKAGTKYVKANYIPQRDLHGNVKGYISLVVDLTTQRRLEEEIRRNEKNLQDFIENANQGLHWVNSEGIIIWANKAEMDMLGYSPEEYIGQPITKFHADRNVIEDILNRLNCNETLHNYEARLIRKDGSIRTVIIDSSVLREGDEFIHTRCFTRDITEWKAAEEELKKKNAELMKINADLDNFIYTASHDLKAPVANIEGLVTTLCDLIKDKIDKEASDIFGMIHHSILRFQNTIKDLTDISKIQRNLYEDVAPINISETIEDVKINNLNLIKESNSKLVVDTSECPVIFFSKANFTSILHNLISNGIKYRHPNRTPVIQIRTRKTAGYAVLEVQDNGLGIKEEQKGKIFEMFKRLHDHVEGSGIGLYIVKRIVDNAEGSIEVESELNKGTTFRLSFKMPSNMN